MLTDKIKGYLSYHHFRVGPASDDYRLSISGFSGNTTHPIIHTYSANGMKFTTRDRDNDKWRLNCAVDHVGNAGGWWYKDCSYIHPNHQYDNIYSVVLNVLWHSLSFIEIKIRPLNCDL